MHSLQLLLYYSFYNYSFVILYLFVIVRVTRDYSDLTLQCMLMVSLRPVDLRPRCVSRRQKADCAKGTICVVRERPARNRRAEEIAHR